MKLIAKVTLVTAAESIPPGGELDVKDKAEAEALIARGFAEAVPSTTRKATAASATPSAAASETAETPVAPQGGDDVTGAAQ